MPVEIALTLIVREAYLCACIFACRIEPTFFTCVVRTSSYRPSRFLSRNSILRRIASLEAYNDYPIRRVIIIKSSEHNKLARNNIQYQLMILNTHLNHCFYFNWYLCMVSVLWGCAYIEAERSGAWTNGTWDRAEMSRAERTRLEWNRDVQELTPDFTKIVMCISTDVNGQISHVEVEPTLTVTCWKYRHDKRHQMCFFFCRW